jgi:hypothetical protein
MLWARMGSLRHGNGQSRTPVAERIFGGANWILRGKNRGRLLHSEGDKVTLAEIAPRLGRQAQENLGATANPDTILGLVRFMQLQVGRSCEAPR